VNRSPLLFAFVGLGAIHCGLTEPGGVVDAGRDAGRAIRRDGGLDGPRGKIDAGRDAHDDAPTPPADTGVDACKPRVPDRHRPSATACSATRPPGYNAVAGVDAGIAGAQCTSDSQCSDGGVNGRCTVASHFFAFCTYDQCTTDSDCGPSSVCFCGAELPPPEGRNPNECIPAMCLVDSDCGPGGYCSPSPNPCSIPGGNFAGITAFDCHTANQLCSDECASNSDCKDAGHNCEWRSSPTGWACQLGLCE